MTALGCLGSLGRYRGLRRAATAAGLVTALLLPAAGGAPGAASAASSPVVVQIAGRAIVFAATAHEGTIYLSQGGYAYLNPGFAFASGTETSGLNATPDIELQTGLASPYSVVGALAVVPTTDAVGAIAADRSIVPRSGELLVVLDGQGRYVLVQIQTVSANALTFAYTFGVAESQPAALGNAVWVAGRPLLFPGAVMRGSITLSANGEVSVSPGFDFELDRQVDSLYESAGLTAAVGANGQLSVGGNLAAVGANGHVDAWPAPASESPSAGALYLLVDGAGNYVLLQVTAVSASSIAFDYRLLPARDVAVLPKEAVTLRIAGGAVTFSGPPRYGAILASSAGKAFVHPGYDLTHGREVSGLSANPDIAVQTSGQTLSLLGTAATFGQLSAGLAPSVASIPAIPLSRFVAVDGAGQYVLVGVESATGQAIAFAYEIESAGPTAVLQPPNPAAVPSQPVSGSGGAIVFSSFVTAIPTIGTTGYDPAAPGGRPLAASAMQLAKTYALSFSPYALWGFAGANADEDPVLSPNGKWLASALGGEIAVRTAGGSTRTIAANGDVLDGALPVMRWSPDSRYLAYTGMVSENGYDGGHALWVIEPSTGKSRLIVDPMRTGLNVAYVGWLPHDRLVFSTSRAFYAVSADWTRVVRLPVKPGAMGQGGRFDVSRDGTMLTWVARDPAGQYQVVVGTINGLQRVQFTKSAWDNWSPQFASSDALVVFVAGTGPVPGGELYGVTLNAGQIGYVDAPGIKGPIAHVLDIEQWYAGRDALAWKAR